MFTSLDGLFITPVCYHPTTILAVDDSKDFLEALATQICDKLFLLCFTEPEKALAFAKNTHRYFPFLARCILEEVDMVKLNFTAIRNEIYNKDRFREIALSVTDYDMPRINGIDLIRTLQFHPEVFKYTHIVLSGKISQAFKEKLAQFGSHYEYVSKDAPDYIEKLLALVAKRLTKIFQLSSYVPARILSRDANEDTFFPFDEDFGKLLHSHIDNNNVCEYYIFDRQGSYLFLDEEANPSWFFVRNDTGIENSIRLAAQYGAPQLILDTLKTREVILGLYEKEDFEKRKTINWEEHLFPASIFDSEAISLNFFKDLIPQSHKDSNKPLRYYYSFSQYFPGHGIEKDKVLSYKQFLQNT